MRFAIFAVCLFAALPAAAQDGGLCKEYGNRAEEVMTFRQNNEAMSEVMRRAGDRDIVKELIIAAYEYPLMSIPENKKEIIREFRNKRELLCYQMFNKKKKP